MSKLIDLTGKQFGRLLIIGRANNDTCGNIYWLCECDCGIEKIIGSRHLKSGSTKSCGCLSAEVTVKRSTKHGHTKGGIKSKTYKAWVEMIQRCRNSKNHAYKHYGGRGISVCQRWRKFENFMMDIGEPPSTKHSIDRIDNNKGYCKSNCRWATEKQQQRNKSNNHLETFDGEIKCLAEFAEETGINVRTLESRIRSGWSIEKALTTPVRERGY